MRVVSDLLAYIFRRLGGVIKKMLVSKSSLVVTVLFSQISNLNSE